MVIAVGDIFMDEPPSEGNQPNVFLLERLRKFCETHQKCYAIVCASILGTVEQTALSALQRHFMFDRLQVMPAHNSNECVECMVSIAHVAAKPTCMLLRERFQRVQDYYLSEDSTLSVVQQAGIGESNAMFLLDGLGSLAGIANASVTALQECSLDERTIAKVIHLFHKV